MRKIPVEQAVGHTLCHDMTAILDSGFKGVKFKRGHVITEADIPELLNIGKSHIFVWEPGADEVHEDDAAIAVADAMCGPGLSRSEPSEGKVTITASARGLFCINSEALKKINLVEDYTVATRPGLLPVETGEKVCGARIIPLVTKRANVEKAVELAREGYPVLSVLPYKPLRAGVIVTGSEVYYGRIEDKFIPIMSKKLAYYGAEQLGSVKCPDELPTISAAIDGFLRRGAELILLTGGMSVDPDDLTPTAIRNTGARVVAQGVPMQPGNMLMLAYLGQTLLVGVPGASMHSKTTALDYFLPRIFAGLEIRKEDIAGLGEGGLCAVCSECAFPNCTFGRS